MTGELPYTEGNAFVAHAMAPIPDPREFCDNLSEELTRVVFKAMAKRPEERYQACTERREAIEAVLPEET